MEGIQQQINEQTDLRTHTVTGFSDRKLLQGNQSEHKCGSHLFPESALPAHVRWEAAEMFPLTEQFGFSGMLMVSSLLGLKFVFSKLD